MDLEDEDIAVWIIGMALYLVTFGAACLSYIWLHQPWVVVKASLRLQVYQEGFKIKYAKTSRIRFCYIERGKLRQGCPSLLILHGFSSSKNDFLMVTKDMDHNLHVILVDLPGHGQTQQPPEQNTTQLITYARDIHDFVTAIGLNRISFHLVGQSFGGAIAAIYSATFPEDLHMLTLICPLITTPKKTQFMINVENGRCELIPETVDEMKHTMNLVTYSSGSAAYPDQIFLGILQMRLGHNRFYHTVFEGILHNKAINDAQIQNAISNIQIPTQIIWGTEDAIIHPSGVEVLKDAIKTVRRVDIISECGHSIHVECPSILAQHILNFRSDILK